MLPKCTRTCLWPSRNRIWRSRSNFLFFGSNKEWRGAEGGKPPFLQRGTVVSGVSCTETGMGKCSFQGCIPTRSSGLQGCWEDASLCWQSCYTAACLLGTQVEFPSLHGRKCAGRASAGSGGVYLPAAMLSWGLLVPRASTKQLGMAASCCLSSIPMDCLSLFELFWGLSVDTLRANSSPAFHCVKSVLGLCPGEAD